MKLSLLVNELDDGEIVAGPAGSDAEIDSLAVDSREVKPGALFAALPGASADGAQFAQQAVERGAVAVLAARPLPLAVPVVVAKNPRRAFARMASEFHGDPWVDLSMLGVTGTNGKTTTTYLVQQLCEARGTSAGLIGTVEVRWPGHAQPATHTTPESHELMALLAQMRDAAVEVVAMEVSSHAVVQERVAAVGFAALAFTNFTRDHLDYHGTMEAYFDAKAQLFRSSSKDAPLVLNLDDAAVAALAAELAGPGVTAKKRKRVIGFSTRGAAGAMVSAENLKSSLQGISFELKVNGESAITVESPLIGRHNAENLLAAFGLLLGLDMPLDELVAAAPRALGAPGRLERVPDPNGRIVLVDYAHTDDALIRVLDALLEARGERPRGDPRPARLIAVFGCGGDRDKGKRPLMGAAAGRRADLTVATSDNPRGEDPLVILREIEPGLAQSGRARLGESDARARRDGYVIVPGRREAIALALACARPGDVVLLAGKGHEPYQIVGKTKQDFDDRLEAAAVLEKLR